MWGTGTGYFEYEFPLPEDFEADKIEEVEFLAELGARYVQGKYKKDDYTDEGSKFYREGYNPVSDPGYCTNMYSMTDEIKHTSTVHITLNGLDEHSVFLEDDPADHRGYCHR